MGKDNFLFWNHILDWSESVPTTYTTNSHILIFPLPHGKCLLKVGENGTNIQTGAELNNGVHTDDITHVPCFKDMEFMHLLLGFGLGFMINEVFTHRLVKGSREQQGIM